MNDNKINLSILDKLVLLALDDKKGNFVSNSLVFGYCMAGAVLFELSIKERIQITENKIKILNRKSLNDKALDYCLELISESKKDRKLNAWIEVIGNKEGTLRKKILEKLIGLEILQEKENKILWIFNNNKYPTKNEVPENLLKKRLNQIITENAKAEADEIMLISLIDSCDLNQEVYGKEIAQRKDDIIKNIVKDYQFAETTGELIKEIHETIITVLIIILASTTISTTTN